MKALFLALLGLIGLASGQYDYRQALSKSILFYEAQRSGRLVNNRIPWRGDSFVNDAEGVDLSGGYFDAGDFVKFGFPFAAALTQLAWSVADYRSAYQSAGELANAQAGIKWGTDWILKATKLDQDTVYAQVGHGQTDHDFWGRPEEFPSDKWRPAFKLTSGQPGSDLAGQYAAALAAASMALDDAGYKQTLLNTAKRLYDFANNNRGKYSDSVTDAQQYYSSYDYKDELGMAAAMIALATGGEQRFRDEAWNKWYEFGLANGGEFYDWNTKNPGVAILMVRVFPGVQDFVNAAKTYGDRWMYSVPKTPKGLIFINEWGTLRHAANVAFGLLQMADLGINPNDYRNMARQQINYMLGSTGRSYVVGFGNNPPTRCHHRAASCRDPPAVCDWNDLNKPDSNGHVLEGALVGGPDRNDQYSDDRNNFQQNEVAIDYNAGFQGALAGLIQLQLKGLID